MKWPEAVQSRHFLGHFHYFRNKLVLDVQRLRSSQCNERNSEALMQQKGEPLPSQGAADACGECSKFILIAHRCVTKQMYHCNGCESSRHMIFDAQHFSPIWSNFGSEIKIVSDGLPVLFSISHRLSMVEFRFSSSLSTGCVVSLRGDWASFITLVIIGCRLKAI